MSATIATTAEGTRVAVRLGGELDLSHVDQIWSAVQGALASKPDQLVVDLSGVTFCDSSVLGVLLRACAAAESRGTSFAVARPSPMASRVLRLSGVDQRLHVLDAVDGAAGTGA